MRRIVLALALGTAAVGVWAAPASVDALGPHARDEPGVVVYGDQADDDFSQAWGAVETHLRGSGFAARSEGVGDEDTRAQAALSLAEREPDLVAVFWWVHDARGDTLFAFDVRARVYLRRQIDVADGEQAAALESLAMIVETTADALRHGDEVAMIEASAAELEAAEASLDADGDAAGEVEPEPEREPEPELEPDGESEAPSASTDPEPRASRRIALWASARYEGEALAPTRPWSSGVGLRAGVGPLPSLGIELGYALHPRVGFSLAPADGDGSVARHTLDLVVAFRRRVHPVVELRAGGGAQLELWRWTAVGTSALRPQPRLQLELGLRLFPHRAVFFELGGFAAASLTDLEFVVCEAEQGSCSGAARVPVLSPHRVRGGLRIGLGGRF